ncbi:MAG: hypothetical protein AAGB10_01325 [Pseudomonadota bacterium]
MSNQEWTDTENDLIVADYFAMLADDVAGRACNKAAHRRQLLPRLNNRSEGSVEFKHQNISAVLKGLGEVWITGYKPAFISRNELAVADERRAEWCLFRLWNFARTPKAFELRPPLDAHVSLTATSFQASFN